LLSRLESALDSERRQREQLEHRLRDAERRLEKALATADTHNDAALLALKSQLAIEMSAVAARAELEHSLLELEFLAQAAIEAESTPASPPAQKVIHYVQVPAASAPAAAPAPPPDWDAKLAAAQMAIEAAEARASHNALQVRKLTEELAAARAEQIRLASDMRNLRERIQGSPTLSAKLAPSSPAPLSIDDAIQEGLDAPVALEAASADDTDQIVARDSGRAGDLLEELASSLAEPALLTEPAAPGLEEALEAWGEPAIDEHAAAEVTEAEMHAAADEDLESALATFGAEAGKHEDSQSTVVEAPAAPVATEDSDDSDMTDALLAALSGDAPSLDSSDATMPEEPASSPVLMEMNELLEEQEPEIAATESRSLEDESGAWASLLEVDTLERLDTPDAPAEQRLAEALMSGAISAERADEQAEGLLEDIESSEPVEEVTRWEPDTTPAAEDDAELLAEWAAPTAHDRLDTELVTAAAVLEDDPESLPVEDETLLVAPAGTEDSESLPPVEQETAALLNGGEGALRESTLDALERAAEARRAQSTVPDEVDAEEDFSPDMAGLVRRGAETRDPQAAPSGDRAGRRKSMVNALQRFIGE
jgi:hypothetical protein